MYSCLIVPLQVGWSINRLSVDRMNFGVHRLHLQSIGKGIATKLDAKLAAHCTANGLSLPLASMELDQDVRREDAAKPKRKTREYVPKTGSGPFAILVAMYECEVLCSEEYRGYMLRQEVVLQAQPLCLKSFSVPDPGSHYTAWASMGTLVTKDLVHKQSNPAQ